MDELPRYTSRQLTELYVRREFDPLSAIFLHILAFFETHFLATIEPATQHFIDSFVLDFLYLFSRPDYLLSPADGVAFIKRNLTISNLVALSRVQTTDAYLEVVGTHANNIVKMLTLYSARNRIKIDRARLFAANPRLAAIWYSIYAGIFHAGLLRPEVRANLQEHYAFTATEFHADDRLTDISYGSTYVDGICDRPVKTALNKWLKRLVGNVQVRNRPNRRKIAVLSCLWAVGHACHRTLFGYLEALKDHYDLTLFYVPIAGLTIDTRHFREVVELKFRDGAMDVAALDPNDFMVAWLPDVGPTAFSVWLSNLRIAPIQIMTTGHPISSFGAEIDYFLSGADVETPEQPEQHYSERLVLIPGFGAVHERPGYEPTTRIKTVPEFVLNCSWSAQKINDRLVEALREIIKRSSKKLRFRVFVGASLRNMANYGPFVRDLAAALAGAVVEVRPPMAYRDYMATMEEGDLALDSFHYGGSNTVVDSLYLRKPIVCLEGDRWYNRIGPQMLRTVGLADLVATSEQEYVEKVLKLIEDDDYRQSRVDHLKAVDLDATILMRADARYFPEAIDHLIANHDRLRGDADRTPIRIERS